MRARPLQRQALVSGLETLRIVGALAAYRIGARAHATRDVLLEAADAAQGGLEDEALEALERRWKKHLYQYCWSVINQPQSVSSESKFRWALGRVLELHARDKRVAHWVSAQFSDKRPPHKALLDTPERLIPTLRAHRSARAAVFCRNGSRRVDYEVFQFDFLGYRFRPRGAKSRAGALFTGFLPAISPKATKAIRQTIRRWRLHCWHTVALVDVAEEINPVLRGWVNYYGRFQRSALHTVFDPLDRYLERWLRRKYKRLKYKVCRAREMLRQIRRRQPALFAHWALVAHGWQ